jgi:hypothetical protein
MVGRRILSLKRSLEPDLSVSRSFSDCTYTYLLLNFVHYPYYCHYSTRFIFDLLYLQKNKRSSRHKTSQGPPVKVACPICQLARQTCQLLKSVKVGH